MIWFGFIQTQSGIFQIKIVANQTQSVAALIWSGIFQTWFAVSLIWFVASLVKSAVFQIKSVVFFFTGIARWRAAFAGSNWNEGNSLP